MSDPLNDFSQPDADLAPEGDNQPDLQPNGDLLGSDDEEKVDGNGDPVDEDGAESDDSDVSLRDVAEREQSAGWS